MNQPIADRVGDSWLADRGVPGRRRELTGDERRDAFAPIFDDFQEVAAFGFGERGQEPVVNREQL